MADLVKKIKIKKQDGTFTDYIPIGAEAQNISTSDGDSVELKLNKKPYYYNTVADMKADTKLKAGDMAVTLGYYEANDGGGATYKITNTASVADYQETLNSGLYATLIVKDTVNVKQLGAYGDGEHDDMQAIQKAVNYGSTINFEKEIYYISDEIVLSSNKKLNGHGATIFNDDNNSIAGFSGENVQNINISNFNFQCKSDGTDGLMYGIKIWNSSNINLDNCVFSTFTFAIFFLGVNKFRITNMTFNQVRTSDHSNKDGIHINGNSYNGYIANIIGTTDDDMIALNADDGAVDHQRIIGNIENIVIENVNTINNQEHGLTNATYRGIKLLSYGSTIKNIVIKNCNIRADYYECIQFFGSSNGIVEDVLIANSHFTKATTTRNPDIVKIITKYKNLSFKNCIFELNGEVGGSCILEDVDTNNVVRDNLSIDNCTFIDNTTSISRNIIRLNSTNNVISIDNCRVIRGTPDNNTLNNVFLSFKGVAKELSMTNINLKNCWCLLWTAQNINNVNIDNINSLNDLTSNDCLITNGGDIGNINISNINMNNTNYLMRVKEDQTNMIVSCTNIITSILAYINASSHQSNIRFKHGVFSKWTPLVGATGDEFTLISNDETTATKKLYSGSQWT